MGGKFLQLRTVLRLVYEIYGNLCGHLGFKQPLIPYLAKVYLTTWLFVEFSCLWCTAWLLDEWRRTSGRAFEAWIFTSRKISGERNSMESKASYWLLVNEDNGSKVVAHMVKCECEWCCDVMSSRGEKIYAFEKSNRVVCEVVALLPIDRSRCFCSSNFFDTR
ncbi:hypothetical protein TNCV_920621 [Trichonephila clavipes]|nr:hypothetical protein TNCV_920621 [Trichonephila clavipes]